MNIVLTIQDTIARWSGRMSRADAERWQEARTVVDLADLTALWLEGEIGSQPGYAAGYGPDPETLDLIPVLADANRAGYLTHQSQPGEPPGIGYDGETWAQRAAVCGYASADLAARLHAAATEAGLIVHVYAPSRRRRRGERHGTTVTTRAGQPYTGFGQRLPRHLIQFLYGDCHPDAVAAIQAAHQVTVIDPEWGRDDRLWPVLAAAVDAFYSGLEHTTQGDPTMNELGGS